MLRYGKDYLETANMDSRALTLDAAIRLCAVVRTPHNNAVCAELVAKKYNRGVYAEAYDIVREDSRFNQHQHGRAIGDFDSALRAIERIERELSMVSAVLQHEKSSLDKSQCTV